MSHILRYEDGVKHATVIGPVGLYQVYQKPVETGIQVEAGMQGFEPIINHTVGAHQTEQADELFNKSIALFGNSKNTVINLDDYARTEPEVEDAEVDTDAESAGE